MSTPVRYDLFSRTLHWLMALFFGWMFCTAIAHYFLEDSALDKFFWPTHKPLGLLLFVLVAVRICWSVLGRKRRPLSTSAVAHIGHLALYTLMFLIPAIGLLRQYGSGRAFSVWGIPVFEEGQRKIQWMIDLGGNFHGELGWALVVLVIGHIAAVVVHHRRGETFLIRRMLGASRNS